jgi:hypothetical protein
MPSAHVVAVPGNGEGMPSKPHDEQYWLERAKEARLQADQLTTPHARRIMLEIAAGYQRLAQSAEERTGRRKVSSG